MTDTQTAIDTDSPKTAPTSRRAMILLVWILLGAVVSYLATALLPHDPYIRYQQLGGTIQDRAQAIYERIHFDPDPIDIAIIGNSRSGRGVLAPDLAATLTETLGRPIHVVNFSLAQEGRNLHWVIARELLEARPEVSLVLLSLIEQAPRTSHPAFRNLANPGDLLASPLLLNREYFDDLGYLPYRQIALFVQNLAPGLFGVRHDFDPSAYAPPNPLDDRGVGDAWAETDAHTPERIAQDAAARVSGITPPLLPDTAADFEFVVERHYTRKIAALAAAKDVAVGFLYFPIYASDLPIQHRDLYEEIGPVFAFDQLAEDISLYRDYGHLNEVGAEKATLRLAVEIAGSVDAGDIELTLR